MIGSAVFMRNIVGTRFISQDVNEAACNRQLS